MKLLRNLTIRRKIALVIFATCLFTLATTGTLQGILLWRAAVVESHQSMRVSTETVGRNCASALVFEDGTYASAALADLEQNESSLAASLYNTKGLELARWLYPERDIARPPGGERPPL